MPNGHGGYRQPRQAAAISGPGALSQRTDGPLGGGSNQPAVPGEVPVEEMRDAGAAALIDASGLVPMEEETLYPDRPVTDGAELGPGANELPGANEDMIPSRSHLKALKFLASMPHASNAARHFVRQLEGELNQNG